MDTHCFAGYSIPDDSISTVVQGASPNPTPSTRFNPTVASDLLQCAMLQMLHGGPPMATVEQWRRWSHISATTFVHLGTRSVKTFLCGCQDYFQEGVGMRRYRIYAIELVFPGGGRGSEHHHMAM